jgi:hypothetical protein
MTCRTVITWQSSFARTVMLPAPINPSNQLCSHRRHRLNPLLSAAPPPPKQYERFLTITHRNISNPAGMPNPELLDFQTRQLVAYLLSLRKPSAAALSRKPPAAQEGSCRAEITRLELVLSQARTSGKAVGSAPESSAARLHHQPTVQSVEQAAREADKTVETALVLARKLEAEGLDAECAAMLKKAEPPVGSQ